MAPKKDQSAVPAADLNPYGTFVNVQVQSATLCLELPAAGVKAAKPASAVPDAAVQPPKTHIVLSYAREWAPVVGSPTEPAPGGVYPYSFVGRFRRDSDMEGLHELLNNPLRVAVHDSTSNSTLAWAVVDLLEFGLGKQTLEFDALSLEMDPALAPGLPKVLPGSVLKGVRLSLTHRPRPLPAEDASESRPGTAMTAATAKTTATKGQAAQGGRGTPTPPAEVYPPESELPPPEPFVYLTPEQLDGATILQLSASSITPLPPNLAAVVTAATEGKAAGKVTFQLGVALPGGSPLLLAPGVLVNPAAADAKGSQPAQTGSLPAAHIHFPQPMRRLFLSAPQARALRYSLEDGSNLKVELARYLAADTLADPAWSAYHAEAVLPGTAALLEPGSTGLAAPEPGVSATFDLPLAGFSGGPSALPSYTPPQGKGVKDMEEAPPAGTCAWAAAGSCLKGVALTTVVPLVPPWAPPAKPPTPLLQLIPPRPELQPYVPDHSSEVAFREEIAAMAQAVTALQLQGSITAAKPNMSLQRAVEGLSQELAASGKLQQMRDALKQSVTAVMMERLSRGIEGAQPTEQARAQMLAQVHAILADALQAAAAASQDTKAVGDQRPKVPQGTTSAVPPQGSRLLTLAHECELQGEITRAQALHQRHVLMADRSSAMGPATASAWFEYGAFCLRQGSDWHGRAEQVLRKGLAASPIHIPCLATLGLLLLHQGTVTDVLLLKEAASTARSLVRALDQQPGQQAMAPMAYGLLLLICQGLGDAARAEDTGAALAALQACETAAMQPQIGAQPSQTSLAGSSHRSASHTTGGGQLSAEASQVELNGGPPSNGDLIAQPSQSGDAIMAPALLPGVQPSQANGLLAVAQLAAQLALPAVSLSALQLAVNELPESSSLQPVTLEMDLAAAKAYTWIYKWAAAAAKKLEGDVQAAQAAAAAAVASAASRAGAAEGGAGLATESSTGSVGSQIRKAGAAGAIAVAMRSMSKRSDSRRESTGAVGLTSTSSGILARVTGNGRLESNNGKRASAPGSPGGLPQVLSVSSSAAARNGALTAVNGALEPQSSSTSVAGEKLSPAAAAAAALAQQLSDVQAQAKDSFNQAKEACMSAKANAASGDARPDVLLGDLHYAASQWQDTVRAYLSAMSSAGQALGSSGAAAEPRQTKTGSVGGSNMSVVGSSNGAQEGQSWFLPHDTEILSGRLPLSLYLRLATSYLQLGHADYALNAYLQACISCPCASVWLGIAQSRVRMHQDKEAEAALAQAADHDAESPAVWAHLALAALRRSKHQEAFVMLSTALRFGLSDKTLLKEISQRLQADLQAASQQGPEVLETAQRALMAALQAQVRLQGADFASRLLLAQMQMDASDVQGARATLEAATQAVKSPEEEAAVQELLPRLLDLQLRQLS